MGQVKWSRWVMRIAGQRAVTVLVLPLVIFAGSSTTGAAESQQLYVGWACADVTPEKPV